MVPNLPHSSRVCLWIKLKLLFLKPKNYSLWHGFFFIWTYGGQELQTFLRSLNEFHTDISRLCSSYEENFIKHKANMKSWFLKREYPEKVISAEMDKVKFYNIERKSNSKTQKGIPLLKSLSSIVDNNIYLLHMD